MPPLLLGVRDPLAARLTVGKLVGATDCVLRAGLLDVEHGHAQVAVVGQRQIDQLRSRASLKKLPPRQFCRGGGRCAAPAPG